MWVGLCLRQCGERREGIDSNSKLLSLTTFIFVKEIESGEEEASALGVCVLL